MSLRRSPAASIAAAALAVALSGPAPAAQSKEDKNRQVKLDQAQQLQMQALVSLVDGVMGGQPPPADIPVTWHHDFLKALDQKTYVPFTLSLDPAQGPLPLTVYLRVAPSGMTAPPPPPKDKKDPNAAAPFPFEDAYFLEARPAAAGEAPRISRAFAVPAGTYDVYVALRERSAGAAEKTSGGTPAGGKTTVLKQQITVPDFWNGDLSTSSIILAERVEPAKEALSKEQQAERPYTLGNTVIVPAIDQTFTKKEELSILFLIYNPALGEDKKPNVVAEYAFHQKTADAEKYFNKTAPQEFNAGTLPPQFDFAAGHQLVAGQSIPLGSFPEGDYRLEIKVTDKNANKTVTRNVNFTVSGA
jgi:hypothetical protein